MTENAIEAAKGTSTLLTQSVISGALRIINTMILARLLLQSEMGQVALIGVIYGFTQFLGAAGLNYASPLVIPHEERQESNRLASFVKRSTIVIIASSTILMLFLLLISSSISDLGLLSINTLNAMIIIIPFSAMEVFLDSVLLAQTKTGKLAIGRLLFDGSRIISTIVLVMLSFGVLGVAIGWFVGEFIAVVCFAAVVLNKLPSSASRIEMKPILAFALPSLMFQFIDVSIQNIDRIILLLMQGLEALGVYDVLLGVLFLMSFTSIAISSSLFPYLTKYRLSIESAEDRDNSFSYGVSTLARYVIIVLMPISITLALNSYRTIEIIFGLSYASYPNASFSFAILAVAYSLWGLTYSLFSVMRALSESKFFIYSGLFVILFEIAGSWYLTQLFGLLGSVLIRVFYILTLYSLTWIKLRQLGIRWKNRISLSIVKVLFSALVAGLLLYYMNPYDLISLALFFLISILVYIFILFLVGEINELDYIITKKVFPSFLQPAIDFIFEVYRKGRGWQKPDSMNSP
ncbi:MAG: oligosaccharide flippase family protein [Candidatus Thorarchaeota archaeon]